MDMTGFLGKKVDLICRDGEKISGYVFDVLDSEDSGIGVDAVDIAPLDTMHTVSIPLTDIADVKIDSAYRDIDFRK